MEEHGIRQPSSQGQATKVAKSLRRKYYQHAANPAILRNRDKRLLKIVSGKCLQKKNALPIYLALLVRRMQVQILELSETMHDVKYNAL